MCYDIALKKRALLQKTFAGLENVTITLLIGGTKIKCAGPCLFLRNFSALPILLSLSPANSHTHTHTQTHTHAFSLAKLTPSLCGLSLSLFNLEVVTTMAVRLSGDDDNCSLQ